MVNDYVYPWKLNKILGIKKEWCQTNANDTSSKHIDIGPNKGKNLDNVKMHFNEFLKAKVQTDII